MPVRKRLEAGTLWVLRWIARLGSAGLFASILARAWPYRMSVDGVPLRVQATLFTRSGLSADTTLGNWEFPHLCGLPVGVHVAPSNVDLLRVTRSASPDTAAYVSRLRSDFVRRFPAVATWLVVETVLGAICGVVLVIALEMAVRYLRH